MHSLQQLQERGIGPDQLTTAFDTLQVEIVLTAHPTEAKRATVLEHHRTIFQLLLAREQEPSTAYEQAARRDQLLAVLALLWRERLRQDDQAGATALLPPLLLTINAIASGLGTTG